MPMNVLSVAEKPSVAKEIAKILAGGEGNFQRRPGHSQYNQLFEINNCPFNRVQVNMVMTSVTGHLMEIEFQREFKSWTGCRPVELFEAPIIKSVKKENEKIETTLIEQARKAQALLLWLDCDTEGENIAFEVIEVCKKANPRLEIYRARFSALIERDILRTVNNPDRPNKHFSDAVDARQEIDLRLGAAFTRFQTLRLQGKYEKLKDVLVSYGPCQFPTLGFVVDRHMKIEAFRPETYWGIHCTYDCEDPDGKLSCNFSWNRGHVYDRYVCSVLYDMCLEHGGNAIVMNVDARPTTRYRPAPMNTIELQRKSSIFLRMGSDRTMSIAESLYQRGILSYPRTETDFFKEGFDLNAVISEQRGHSQWGEYASNLLDQNKFLWPKNGGHDDQAHPPIHPTKRVEPNEFQSDEEKKLYDLITRHFLACCSHDGKGNQTNIVIRIPDIHGEVFTATGLMILERNWLDVYTYEKWVGNQVPRFDVGDEFTPKSLMMTSGVTAPPLPISESDLISEMDKNGIGTDATIAEHIKTIQKREYVLKDAQNRFIPTKLGLALVEGYNSMGYQLAKPHLRASMEADCHKIARGELQKDDVIRACIAQMRECFLTVNREAGKLDTAVSKYFDEFGAIEDETQYQIVQHRVSRCGRCQQLMDMKLQVAGRDQHSGDHLRRLLYCSECNKGYTIPSKGNIRPHDVSCALCSFQAITIVNQETNKEHQICPHCFKNPPGPPASEDGVSEFRCFSCAHTGCPLAGRVEGADVDIAPCSDQTCNGKMHLNKNARGYMISCNRQGCTRTTWWLPRSITSAIARAEHTCMRCMQRKGIMVVKIALVIDIRLAPRGLSPEALVCPCCDDIWEDWNQTLLPLPTAVLPMAGGHHQVNPHAFAQPQHHQFQFPQQHISAASYTAATSDYGAALTGAVVTKGRKSNPRAAASKTSARGAASSSTTSAGVETPNCKCSIPSKSCVTVKEGPNKGRRFYACSKSNDQKCGFFLWVDEQASGGGTRTATAGGSVCRGDMVCFHCQQHGHFSKQCPNR